MLLFWDSLNVCTERFCSAWLHRTDTRQNVRVPRISQREIFTVSVCSRERELFTVCSCELMNYLSRSRKHTMNVN